jgi:hypothetical protein
VITADIQDADEELFIYQSQSYPFSTAFAALYEQKHCFPSLFPNKAFHEKSSNGRKRVPSRRGRTRYAFV